MATTNDAFALTGLTSRGGLSNWVLFWFPEELVLVDVGIVPALKAGALAGALSQLDVVGDIVSERVQYGPQQGAHPDLDAWCAELSAKAKNIVRCRDAELRGVRLHLRAMAHQLHVALPDGELDLDLMNRSEAERAAALLEQRLGARFEVSSTAVFAFFQRHAPFLMK